MKRFLPLLMLTGLLFGQERTQYSGIERNDIFQEYNEQPHEGDPTVLFNSGFQHLNTIRNRDGDLYLRYAEMNNVDLNNEIILVGTSNIVNIQLFNLLSREMNIIIQSSLRYEHYYSILMER